MIGEYVYGKEAGEVCGRGGCEGYMLYGGDPEQPACALCDRNEDDDEGTWLSTLPPQDGTVFEARCDRLLKSEPYPCVWEICVNNRHIMSDPDPKPSWCNPELTHRVPAPSRWRPNFDGYAPKANAAPAVVVKMILDSGQTIEVTGDQLDELHLLSARFQRHTTRPSEGASARIRRLAAELLAAMPSDICADAFVEVTLLMQTPPNPLQVMFWLHCLAKQPLSPAMQVTLAQHKAKAEAI